MFMKLPHAKDTVISVLLLSVIIYLAISVRSSTLSAQTVLDYDPWWYYRHAIEVMNNNYRPPSWDILSYYPPGRPYEISQLGWVYTMIIFFKATSLFSKGISFLYVAKASPLIMVALGAIPAFLLGKLLSNKWGGLSTALFAVLTPTFIGVSMAGYTDNDPVVVFYTFLTIYSIFLALEKKTIPYYVFAILTNLLFAFNWGGGWFVMMLFTAFLPALLVFRVVEDIIHQRKLKIDITHTVHEMKSLLLPIAIIFIITNVLGYFLGLGSVFGYLPVISAIISPQQALLVNISVAELQSINIFTTEGFYAVAGRVGQAPLLFAMLGLPILVAYKIFKKTKINSAEVFMFLWILVTFYMILKGVRFSLLFSIAVAVASGYVIGNFKKYQNISLLAILMILIFLAKDDRTLYLPTLIVSLITLISFHKPSIESLVKYPTIVSVTLLLMLIFVSNSIQVGYASTGMEVSQNWIDGLTWLKQNVDNNSLVVTWWDPGHIIAGFTGLKVMADGAHCGPSQCTIYNHNTRIQDMGRSFSTNSENEAIQILQKYSGLTQQQCLQAKKTFGDKLPDEACNPISEMYIIASSDLIGKYYWMSYFGDCLRQFGVKNAESCYNIGQTWFMKNAQGKNFIQLSLSSQDQQGNLIYGGIITLTQKDNRIVPIINIPQQGIRNALIKQIVYFKQDGSPVFDEFNNVTNTIDGMLWVDPSFRAVIFMDPSIRDSLFTRMFFWNGQGLEKFELKYSNAEMRIFKVKFD